MQLTPEDQSLLNSIETAFSAKRAGKSENPIKIGLAVSGGGDSMAMLHLFAQCADTQNYQLEVATVDHGLREGAKDEAAFVGEVCESLGLPHSVLTWTGWDGKGNLQAEARKARYGLLAEWGLSRNLDVIALGHTKDDLVETFFMRLARGSGVDGLAAMEKQFERGGVAFIRPLIHHDRAMLRGFLTRHGQRWCEDPSNEDERFDRVKTRKVLKALEPLGIDRETITQTANDLAMAKDALKRETRDKAEALVRFESGDVVMDRVEVSALPAEIERRMFSALLGWVGGTEFPPRSEAVRELLQHYRVEQIHTLNGCLVTSDKREIRFSRELNAVEEMACPSAEIWDGRWTLDGPHSDEFEVRVLGEAGLVLCPDWRETGLPRRSLLSSPAIWKNGDLVAAPLANLPNGWTATLLKDKEQFLATLLSH